VTVTYTIMIPCLPTETLHEIARYLPRYVLKSLLLFQPHPVGQVASYVYFSTVSLHFGVRDNYGSWESDETSALMEWHDKRSFDILMTIAANNDFAKKVQTLKIYSPGMKDADPLVFQTNLLNIALPKMTRLRALECYGMLKPMRVTISKLSETVPSLQRLHLGDCINRRGFTGLGDVRIHHLFHLDQLVLYRGWQDHFSLTDLPKDLEESSIKKLHITYPYREINMLAPCITPALISFLTHLSLKTPQNIVSAFEIALKYGDNLQSLRIQGKFDRQNSQYFRHYVDALPNLTEFGIFICDSTTIIDDDFFPAVCDFLRSKATQLVHLELRAPEGKIEQDQLGFGGGKECWALFKNVSRS